MDSVTRNTAKNMKKNIKIAMCSDLHGNIDFEIPEVDLLLIAGDLCPARSFASISINMQIKWLGMEFKHWLKNQPVKEVVYTPGNHDWIWESAPKSVPKMPSNSHYLQDEWIELFGLKIYGTPWQLPFNDWAFNMPEDRLKWYWENIPEDTDILLCHAPPYGIMDQRGGDDFSIGSKTLLERVMKIKPKMVVFGHNHNKNGVKVINGIKFINCSLLNEDYKMIREPIVEEWEYEDK